MSIEVLHGKTFLVMCDFCYAEELMFISECNSDNKREQLEENGWSLLPFKNTTTKSVDYQHACPDCTEDPEVDLRNI